MSSKIDKSLILNKIKSHYAIKKDIDFAKFLGLSQSAMSTWHKRNTFDAELIIAKCVDIDANWLLTGKGEMLKTSHTTQPPLIVPEPKELPSTKTLSTTTQGATINSTEGLSLIIETQQKLITSLEKNVEYLEDKLRFTQLQLAAATTPATPTAKSTQKVH